MKKARLETMLPGIGVFGTGDIVRALVPFLRAKGFRVEAVWGRTLDAAENVATELNIPFHTNKVDDVLLRKDVDLVFIICQPDLHAQIAVKALGIGKHVLCDRPAGLCQRATRVHGMMRTFTKSTEKINGIRWIDSDDFCSFQMILDGGICVTATLNSHMAGGFVQEVVVCGSRGRLVVRGANLYGQNTSLDREELIHEGPDDVAHLTNKNSNARINSLLPQPYLQGLFRLVGALKEAFATGDGEHGWLKEPVSSAATFEDGQYVQAVIDAIKLSSASRQWEQVTVANDENELNPLMTRLNLPNINMSSLDALSQAPTNRPPPQRKVTSSESHLPWSFATKH
ncbi:glucose-fructose oxidoreductase domain-containing protein 2-like isoform X5 [Macrobrachium nipponense]|uniref:glucose-fructose oxidoreductase domain-containing protein 2-like isoform X5 n=1 Tax=Macrobrachium nipponense TaxID=159736 RepID=UPI0030C894E4